MTGGPVPEGWVEAVADAVASAVREFAERAPGVEVVLLDVGCCPWNGMLELSALTAAEATADPALTDPAGMASWRYYNFASGPTGWGAVERLGWAMRRAYEASDEPAQVADAFLAACAAAVAEVESSGGLAPIKKGIGFRISVAHPDSGQVYYPPAAS